MTKRKENKSKKKQNKHSNNKRVIIVVTKEVMSHLIFLLIKLALVLVPIVMRISRKIKMSYNQFARN